MRIQERFKHMIDVFLPGLVPGYLVSIAHRIRRIDGRRPGQRQPGAESRPSDSFHSFVSSRCRAYVLSDKPVGMPVPGSDEHVCNCYSSGEELNVECIMPAAWKDMLEWLTRMYESPELCEEQLKVQDGVGQKPKNGVEQKLKNGVEQKLKNGVRQKLENGVEQKLENGVEHKLKGAYTEDGTSWDFIDIQFLDSDQKE